VIVDTSALVAILMDEPDAPRIAAAIRSARGNLALSAATLVEATMVLEGRGGERAGRNLDAILHHMDAEVVAVDRQQAETARRGWRRFGKGRHRAALNLGDCFAYALAMERGEPLLFKGDDFARTDVKRAL
jgi:ribonuclease VapC